MRANHANRIRAFACAILATCDMLRAAPSNARGPCACNADLDASGIVDMFDQDILIACLISPTPECDVNCDGTVDQGDQLALACSFNAKQPDPDCCRPFGACCRFNQPCFNGTQAQCQTLSNALYRGDDVLCSDGCCCDADVNNNGSVDILDFGAFLACPPGNPACDLNCDGAVDNGDYLAIECSFLSAVPDPSCCGPLGACCRQGAGCVRASFDACLGAPTADFLGTGSNCVDNCCRDADCALPDDDVCTCDRCTNHVCTSAPIGYGNVNCSALPIVPNLDDIICALSGFSNFASCPNADIAPVDSPIGPPIECAGDNVINIDDLLAVLNAFSGLDPCGCMP